MPTKAKTDVWMPLYIADYLADTSRLTTMQHGAYMLLIMDYWRNGALPDDDSILAQITRMTPDAWSIARASIEHFFEIINGQWTHKRIESEINKAGVNSQKAHDRATKAAAARWGKEQTSSNSTCNAPSIPPSSPTVKLDECPSPSPSPSPILKPKQQYSDDFESAWSAYPPRTGANKKDSYKAWCARIKAGVSPNVMIEGAALYARYCKALGTESQFIKQPATFFGPGEHYLTDWSIPTPINSSRPAKFDPVAYVNQGRKADAKLIDIN